MGPAETYLIIAARLIWARLAAARDQDGYSVQVVILTALLAALAIAVGAIITTKVLTKANSINLNGSGG